MGILFDNSNREWKYLKNWNRGLFGRKETEAERRKKQQIRLMNCVIIPNAKKRSK